MLFEPAGAVFDVSLWQQRNKAVADSGLCLNEARRLRVGLDLLAQMPDMDAQSLHTGLLRQVANSERSDKDMRGNGKPNRFPHLIND